MPHDQATVFPLRRRDLSSGFAAGRSADRPDVFLVAPRSMAVRDFVCFALVTADLDCPLLVRASACDRGNLPGRPDRGLPALFDPPPAGHPYHAPRDCHWADAPIRAAGPCDWGPH